MRLLCRAWLVPQGFLGGDMTPTFAHCVWLSAPQGGGLTLGRPGGEL